MAAPLATVLAVALAHQLGRAVVAEQLAASDELVQVLRQPSAS